MTGRPPDLSGRPSFHSLARPACAPTGAGGASIVTPAGAVAAGSPPDSALAGWLIANQAPIPA